MPVPSAQRRRRNKPETPVDTAPAAAPARGAEVPTPSADWHPIAREWFVSLGESGQARFYEPSDWATARLGAEMMSRLCSQEKPSAQLLASVLAITSSVLATEGDRRRLRLELARGPVVDTDEDASVTALADYMRENGA